MSEEKQEAPEVQEENIVKVSLKKEDLETVNKVDLSQKAESLEPEGTSEEAALEKQVEEVKPAIEEVTESETEPTEDIVEQAVEASVARTLPEGVEKLVEFISQTGGTVQDYVDLNRDYSEMDNLTALQEYYKTTKPHLSSDERAFLMEENFSFDEEIDDEKDIKRKKIALKEQVAEAKAYLDGQKSKYYEEIKGGSKLPEEAKKAMDFFNRYNKKSDENQKELKRVSNVFKQKTENVFNEKFEGFEYEIGNKKFRFNVKDSSSVKETQGDINNFVKRFLNEDGSMEDAKGYHKGLYTAMNADSVAQHFYEQGKADALKTSVEKAKNINMDPRQSHKEVQIGGTKYKVLSGDSPNDYKVRIKKGRK
jgi:hypothetical protein